MKKLISLLLLFSLLTLALASCSGGEDPDDTTKAPSTAYSQGLAYQAVDGDPTKCIITGIGSCTDKEIVIPTYINGMLVVGIADGAFSPRAETLRARNTLDRALSGATDTSAPVTGTANGDFAIVTSPTYAPVYGFAQMVPVDKGEGYETGTGTPIDLEEIESVKIPASVTAIGDEAFLGCEELETISTHTQISSIGQDAFKDTAYYNNPQNWEGKALYLSNYLLSVDSTASGEFTVKEGTTVIASYAFYNCEGMTTVNLSSTVYYIGSYAFSGCIALENVVASQTYYSYSNSFDGCISYKPYNPGQGGALIPGFGATEEEKYPATFDKISEADFESIKAAPQHVYTYEIQRGEGTDLFKTDGITSHYIERRDGVITRELYADTDENGLVTYMKRDDGLYFTTATMPDPYAILSQISFDELTHEETTGNLYFYEEGDTRLQIGFKEGKLRLVNFLVPGQSIQTWFYDFDKTTVPQIPREEFVPGVTLDENGNAR